MSLRTFLRQEFHGATLPAAFETSPLVVVCFHGHTNSARDSAQWPVVPAFPRGACFLHLNAPHRYAAGEGEGGYEWFPYVRDWGVDAYDVEPSRLAASVDGMMRTMNLQARKHHVLTTVQLVARLVALLAAADKDVYFVGTSQGAATAFTAALHVLSHPTADASRRLRGGFFHHMAGVYPAAFPRALPPAVAERVVVKRTVQDDEGRRASRMKKGIDLHGAWLPEEAHLLRDAASALAHCEPARLVVVLNLHDHVVPIALQRHLADRFPNHRARLPRVSWKKGRKRPAVAAACDP